MACKKKATVVRKDNKERNYRAIIIFYQRQIIAFEKNK